MQAKSHAPDRMPDLREFFGTSVYTRGCEGYLFGMAIAVAVAGAGDVVTRGLWEILHQAPDLHVMCDFVVRVPHTGVHPEVVLYDVVRLAHDGGEELTQLIRARETAVVVVGRDLRPDLARRALALGASGCVSLDAPAADVLAIIREAVGGDLTPDDHPAAVLGAEAGLTCREGQILADVVKGFSNADIARRQAISINTIKTYIRSTYRKIGVTSRAQAVSWGIQHGFAPDDAPRSAPAGRSQR